MIAHRTTYAYCAKVANPHDSNNTADAVVPEQWSRFAEKKKAERKKNEAHFPPEMRPLIQGSQIKGSPLSYRPK
jgi:hypothetical protein